MGMFFYFSSDSLNPEHDYGFSLGTISLNMKNRKIWVYFLVNLHVLGLVSQLKFQNLGMFFMFKI